VKVEFRASFLKDIGKIKSKAVLKRIKDVIENVEKAETLQTISDLKKLKGGNQYCRIGVGEYRIGLSISEDSWVFVRCLHRKDTYRYFP
jgi:mRNA interferase RelE/StbE